jgi:ABC-type antimicrobial peptide transport system permease subunit
VLSVDDSQPVARVATLDDLVAESIGDRRATMLLLTVFAGLAALLASVGIYGVMSHTVAERRRELGIRMTCGATGPALLRMVVGHGMALAAIGTAVGVAVVPLIGRSIQGLLYQISPLDPATLATVAALILLVAAVSILLPAVRAARSDPLVCMRGR